MTYDSDGNPIPPGHREAMIVVCRRCGSYYDMDFCEALDCHDEDNDWAVALIVVPDGGPYVFIAV